MINEALLARSLSPVEYTAKVSAD